jgi:signal transduction histidine kinase
MVTAETSRRIESLYSEELEHYLSGGGESALRAAYEVGRLALTQELGVLGMAALHHSALVKILAGIHGQDEAEARLKAASQFFAESLSPYEMAHRGFRDAIIGLRLLNETLEQEIKRIAHSVHDEAGQLLVVVHLAMAEISRDLPPAAQKKVKDVTELLRQVEEQLRGLSHELRPAILDDLGLVPTVEFLTDRVAKRSGLTIRVAAALDGRLLPAIETALYRIIQEALNNATRHSHAKNVWIQLDGDDQRTRCSIRDDGVGFDAGARLAEPGRNGLGFIGIQERLSAVGGTLQITSQPGAGTVLLITVPKEPSGAHSGRTGR